MVDDKRDISGIEIGAMSAAEEGLVSDILEMTRTEGVPEDITARVMKALPQAVRVATKKGWLTEAIEVIGAEDVPETVQIEAIGIIAENGVSSWIGGLIGKRDIPEAVQAKIVDVLAEEGGVPEILDIIGTGNVSDAVHDKARMALSKAITVAGEDRVKQLTPDEKVEALGIMARMLEARNPLQKDGVLSKGTVKKPPSAGKDASSTRKGTVSTNKS